MAIIQIPKKYQGGFAKLAKLDNGSFKALAESLSKIPLAVGGDKFIEGMDFPEKAKAGVVREILAAVGSLSMVGERRGLTPKELGRDVASRASVAESNELNSLSDKELESLADRVEKLLGLDSVYYSIKAADLLTEHEHTLMSSRIITDCRPIFGREIDGDPKAAVIVHMLQIHFHDNDEHREMYFAMDDSDLTLLKKIVDRAEKKAQKLRTTFLKSEVKIL